MNSAAADTLTRDIRAQLNGIFSCCYSKVRPVKLLGAFLIRDKVACGNPMRTGLEHNDFEASLSQLLAQHTPGCRMGIVVCDDIAHEVLEEEPGWESLPDFARWLSFGNTTYNLILLCAWKIN